MVLDQRVQRFDSLPTDHSWQRGGQRKQNDKKGSNTHE